MVEENSLLSYRVTVPTNSILFPLSFWLQFSDLSGLFSFILEAIKRCFNPVKYIKRCFPNQNPRGKKKLWTQITLRLICLMLVQNNYWRTQKPETKIESKPMQQKKNSLKSNISYPNLGKMEKTYRYRFRRSDGGRYIANGVDAHRFFFLLAAVL